jgi:hypothetical protein
LRTASGVAVRLGCRFADRNETVEYRFHSVGLASGRWIPVPSILQTQQVDAIRLARILNVYDHDEDGISEIG